MRTGATGKLQLERPVSQKVVQVAKDVFGAFWRCLALPPGQFFVFEVDRPCTAVAKERGIWAVHVN